MGAGVESKGAFFGEREKLLGKKFSYGEKSGDDIGLPKHPFKKKADLLRPDKLHPNGLFFLDRGTIL